MLLDPGRRKGRKTARRCLTVLLVGALALSTGPVFASHDPDEITAVVIVKQVAEGFARGWAYYFADEFCDRVIDPYLTDIPDELPDPGPGGGGGGAVPVEEPDCEELLLQFWNKISFLNVVRAHTPYLVDRAVNGDTRQRLNDMEILEYFHGAIPGTITGAKDLLDAMEAANCEDMPSTPL